MVLNNRNFEEKRNFIRMSMNASADLTLADGQSLKVTCIDLSANGMSVKATHAVNEGAKINVKIESPNAQFQSMDATGTVVRAVAMPDGSFELGVELDSID